MIYTQKYTTPATMYHTARRVSWGRDSDRSVRSTLEDMPERRRALNNEKGSKQEISVSSNATDLPKTFLKIRITKG